jgi:hypothetical protein
MKVAMAASEVRSSGGSHVVSLTAISFHPFSEQSFRRIDILCLASLVASAMRWPTKPRADGPISTGPASAIFYCTAAR